MAAVTRPLSQSVAHSQKQKPVEWIASLIQRYQDQLPTRRGKALDRESRELLNTTHLCIINVSRHHVHLVLLALVRVLKAVNASKWTSDVALSQSRQVILNTLHACLNGAQPTVGRNVERESCMKAVLEEMWIIINAPNAANGEKAQAVVSRVGDIASSVVMGRAERALATMQMEESSEEAIVAATRDVSLMGYVTLDLDALVRFLQMVTGVWPPRKEHVEIVCNMVSSLVCRWIERFPEHFSALQHSPQENVSDAVDALFNAMNSPEGKRRSVCWPVQMILIAVSPCSLEAIAHAEQQGVCLPESVVIKRQFVEMVSSVVQTGMGTSKAPWSMQLQHACHAAVNLCKCATYVNQSDFFVFNVVQQVMEHVKVVLLTGARPREMERAVLVDCFVALFRLKFDNDVFRVCLSSQQPLLQLVLVEALTVIASQKCLQWWPRIEMLASRSDQMRALLLSTLEKVLECEPSMSAGHVPLSMTRSWQKVSGRWRVDRPSSSSLGSIAFLAECSHHTILIAIIKLITVRPSLLIRKKTATEDNSIESVVSGLVLLIDHPQLQVHALKALLALHSQINDWNSCTETAMETFLTVSSHMLFSICQKLIHLQVSNAESVVFWLKALMRKRNAFLVKYTEENVIAPELLGGIVHQSLIKFEVVCFLYLWNSSADLVLCCLSLFRLAEEECNILSSSSIQVDCPLTKVMGSVLQSSIVTAGRVALQKSVNKILRSLESADIALVEAWHESLRVWEMFTNQLVLSSNDHADFVQHVAKVTTDGTDCAALVDSWSSITAFLCSLSHLIINKENNLVTTYVNRLLTVLRMDDSPYREVMCKCVKEQLSFEMDSQLDQVVLHSIASQLTSHCACTLFVEHVIYILKNILCRRQGMVLRVDSTSETVNALLQSQSAADRNAHSKATFTRKLCALVQVIVSNGSARRLPSQLQQRMLESVAGYISTLPPPAPFSVQRSELLLSILNALSRLLGNMSIPIQPATFNKIFNDLLETYSHSSSSCHASPLRSRNPVEEIANASVAPDFTRRCNDALLTTLAALVNANPDLGVSRVVDTCWGGEYRLRGCMLETLTRVVLDHSAPSSTVDRHGCQSELVRLMCQQAEDGSLPLVSALAQSIPSDMMDKLCRVCVCAFSERGELGGLVYSVLWGEAESALSPATLFRGSSFAAKLISWCLRVFGHSYLLRTVRPLLEQLLSTMPDASYDVDDRWGGGSGGGENGGVVGEDAVEATRTAANIAFNHIIRSVANAPPKFRQVCAQMYTVINTRFPGVGLSALGKILFLRFFNPAIVSPYEMQVCSVRPSRRLARTLTLVSKLLQSAANGVANNRDTSIAPFPSLIQEWQKPLQDFVGALLEDCAQDEALPSPAPSNNLQLLVNTHSLFVSDKAEFLRLLQFSCGSSSLYSRVDALLKSLPEHLAPPPAPSETLDPSLPFFIQLSSAAPPIFAVILRRLQNVEVENAAKLIGERVTSLKWVCLLDGLMCYDPPNLMKLFSADVFAHIDRVLVLHPSTQLFNKLMETFPLLQTLRINFDPVSLKLPLDALPIRSKKLLNAPVETFPAILIGSEEVQATVKMYDNMVAVSGERKWGDMSVVVTDLFQCTDFEQMEQMSADVVTVVQGETIVSLQCDCAAFIAKLTAERMRVAKEEIGGVLPPLRANALNLISLAFVHLSDPDVSVRSTAYRLLSSLSQSLELPTAASLQETPCVLVPANSLQFLQATAVSLVSHEPLLLTLLVPRILDTANLTLVHSLAHCWPLVSELREDVRGELFSCLSAATSSGGALSAAICHAVWPRIGMLHNATLHNLLDRLLFSCPLSASLSIVQATCTGGDRLAALIVERTISQLSSAERRMCVSRLMAFLLVVTFDANVQLLESHLAHLMHIISCVAGTGPPFLRAATYTLVTNIFHSFGSNRELALTEEKRRSLALFLRQLVSEDTMRLFRVGEVENGQQVVEALMHQVQSDTQLGDRGEEVNESGSGRLMGGSGSDDEGAVGGVTGSKHADLLNMLNLIVAAVVDLQREQPSGTGSRDWLVEWRVLARHWAFEGRGEVQIRSLIAFSCLAETISEQEMKEMLKLLVQVVKRRESLSAMAGVTLSLVRVHTLTPTNSSSHTLIFWIAIILFQLENATIYEHAIQLLHANLTHLDHMGVFDHTSLDVYLMEGRAPLEWDLKSLDQCAGLSFRANFHFALVGYLLKGLRQPGLCVKVVQLLQLLLRIISKQTKKSAYALSEYSLPYLLALLPFDEKVSSRFRLATPDPLPNENAVLTDAWEERTQHTKDKEGDKPTTRVWNNVEEEEGEGKQPLLDPSVLLTEQQQALSVTVLAILARNCPNIDVVLDYLLEAVTVFPSVVPVVETLLDQRIVGLVQSCQSPRMLSTLVRLIETSVSGDTQNSTPAVFFLQQCGFAGLWRYAGAFLSQRASLQAINSNLCSCLECILATL